MKKLLIISLALIFPLVASTAFADRGHGGNGYYASKGDRIERHLDRKGDRIERHFYHKADRADSRGKHYKADRLRAKGDRIDRHLDHKGYRIHDRFDRRHDHKHNKYYRGKHHRDHRHYYYYPRPRVVYRDYRPHDTYFGLVINQPGLWLGWGWYD